MKNDINFVSMIHLADTDGNRFVAIYKPMSEEERQALLERYWQENRWGTRFGAPDILDVFPLDDSCFPNQFDDSCFPNQWFENMSECERNSKCSY